MESHMLKCSVCHYETEKRSNLNRHELTHLNDKEFKCSTCPFETKTREQLKRHETVHHEREFKCPLCPFEARRKYLLSKHNMKIHQTSQLPKKEAKGNICPLCDYATDLDINLRQHLKSVHNALLK